MPREARHQAKRRHGRGAGGVARVERGEEEKAREKKKKVKTVTRVRAMINMAVKYAATTREGISKKRIATVMIMETKKRKS